MKKFYKATPPIENIYCRSNKIKIYKDLISANSHLSVIAQDKKMKFNESDGVHYKNLKEELDYAIQEMEYILNT